MDAEPVLLDHERMEMLRDLDDGGSYLRGIIDRFGGRRDGLLDAVATAAAEGDPEALRATAHSLKGTLTNLGLVEAGRCALALERLGAAGTVEGADELLVPLREAVAEGHARLLEYRATLDDDGHEGDGVGPGGGVPPRD